MTDQEKAAVALQLTSSEALSISASQAAIVAEVQEWLRGLAGIKNA